MRHGSGPLRRGAGAIAALVVLCLAAVVACGSGGGAASGAGGTSTTDPPATAELSTTAIESPAVGPTARERVAVLEVDDRPSPRGIYRREDWPHWADVDGNGCDARQDTLLRWTSAPAVLDPARRCKVVSGSWRSPYDGAVVEDPAGIEIDHLVPLAEAFRSGGWQWDAGERRRFANDPLELVAASSASNRSKSDDRPDEWRPARTETWCAYADRWVAVKATYRLTVTTSERDALGQMLDTCTATSERWP